MQSKILLGILVMASVVLTACQGGTSVAPLSTPFVGGQTGLTLEFAPASPPNEIFDDEQFPFSVVINVENRGEYDLEDGDGFIELDSINGETFGVSDSALLEDIPEIEGARKNLDGTVTEGFRDVVSFDDLNYQADIKGDLAIDIRAAACYNYQTQTTTNVCIKEESIDGIQENEVCRIGEDKAVQNSGGPIHITKLTELSKGRDGIQVVFTVEHVGEAGALFYRPDADCDRRINNPEKYQVYVEVEPLVGGSIRADCAGFQDGTGDSGYITLFNGQPRSVTCSFDTGSINRDFIEPLDINLEYRYQQFIQKQVVIKDVTTNR